MNKLLILLLTTSLLLDFNLQAKIRLNNKVFTLETFIDPKGNQIAKVPFHPDQEVLLLIDFDSDQLLLPGEGFTPTFECKKASHCEISKQSDSFTYSGSSSSGSRVKTVLGLEGTVYPETFDKSLSFEAGLLTKSPSWKFGEYGVLGLGPKSPIQAYLATAYNNFRDNIEYQYKSDLETKMGDLRVINVELNINRLNSEGKPPKAKLLKSNEPLNLYLSIGKEKALEKNFKFDNKKNFFIGIPEANTVVQTISNKICGKPACVKGDNIKIENGPVIKISINGDQKNEEDGKIELKPEQYAILDNFGNLKIYIQKIEENILGSFIFGVNGASIFYSIDRDNLDEKYFGFGFGTKPEINKILWILVAVGVGLGLIFLVGLLYLYDLKKEKKVVDDDKEDEYKNMDMDGDFE